GFLAWAVDVSEATVKAAFLYKFAAYVDWPDTPREGASVTPFVIGVMGNDEVYVELERIVAGRNIGGRPLAARQVKDSDGLKGLQMLFVGRADSGRIASMARAAQSRSILLVTESDRGLEQGGLINFVVSESRVGFEVSLEAAERCGLRVSSRMLGVARRV